MSKPSEAKRRRREARRQAGWHPLAEWYRATNGAIVPNSTIATHQFALFEQNIFQGNYEKRRSKIYERGQIVLPDEVLQNYVLQAQESEEDRIRVAKALDEATRRCKLVVKLGE
jgi:hypothetical protein